MKKIDVILLLLFMLIIPSVFGQHAFQDEIKKFVTADSLHAPGKNKILFVGSSSIRLWKTLEQDFKGLNVINRGFGGSSIEDVIFYADKIIFPYKPKQILLYAGENDIAAGKKAEQVFEDFKTLFSMIREKCPGVEVGFISIKPSPSRTPLIPEMRKANDLIKTFLSGKRRTAFIDVHSLMLDADGQPREELFVDDKLHMNEKGYAIWTNKVRPYLK
jgi:lysophospholipase L1-like esterase